MAVFAGPKIVDDGLIFHYDMDNVKKSFKGKPTTNLANGKFFDGNNNFSTDETIQDVLPDGTIGDVRYLNADNLVDPNRTVSIGNYSMTANETYTLSFYVKNINCTGFGGNLYSPGLGRVIGSITYPEINNYEWTRVVTTFTIPDEGVDPVSMSPQAFRDAGYGFFKMCWLQMEQGSFATPYVGESRSNTEAILDLTGTNTITTSSLTYVSDGTFEFNGTSSFSTFTDPLVNNTFSLEWMMRPGAQDSFFITPQSNGIDNFIRYDSVNQRIGITVCESADTNQLTYWSSDNLVPVNQWTHCVVTINASGEIYIYINGFLNKFFAYGFTPSNWTGTWYIGQRGNGTNYYLGDFTNFKVYNRVLLENEVLNNFESLRSRFDLEVIPVDPDIPPPPQGSIELTEFSAHMIVKDNRDGLIIPEFSAHMIVKDNRQNLITSESSVHVVVKDTTVTPYVG